MGRMRSLPHSLGGLRWMIALMAGVLAVGALSTSWSVSYADREMREERLDQALQVARAVSLQRLETLTGTSADVGRPEYLRIKKQFAAIKMADEKCRFVYLMGRRSDGQVFFYVDNEPVGSKDESPAGQSYDEISAEYLRAFDTKTALTVGPVADRWGTWVTSLAPIVDPTTDELLAVLGMDVAAKYWQVALLRAAIPPIVATLALLAIILAGMTLSARYKRSDSAVNGRFEPLEPVMVAAVGLVLTLLAATMAHMHETRVYQKELREQAIDKSIWLTEHFRSLRDVELEGLARFIESSEDVSPSDFQRYASHLAQDPVVQAWEWIPVVPAEKKEQFETQARMHGITGFSVWQEDSSGNRVPALDREAYYPVYCISPLVGNEPDLGFDVGSETLRRTALEEAAVTGLAACTDPITIAQDTDRQVGTLVCRPVFSTDGSRSLRGFALAALKMEDVLQKLRPNREVALSLSMSYPESNPVVLASSLDQESRSASQWSVSSPVLAFGKTFIVTAYPGPDFDRSLRPVVWLAPLSGVVVTISVVIVLSLILRHRRRLKDMVTKLTSEFEANRAHLNTLIQTLPDLVWLKDPEGVYLNCNSRFERFFGRAESEIVGRTDYDFMDRESAEFFREKDRAAEAAGRPCLNEEEVTFASDGHREILETIKTPMYDANGKLMGVLGIARDITERKRTEQALCESEKKYRTLFENMAQGAFYQRADGIAVDVNQASLEMFGLARDQFLGRTSMDQRWKVIREDGSELAGEQHPSMEALRTGKPVLDVIVGVFNPRREDYVWLSVSAIPQFRDGESEPYEVFVTLHDITERKRAEEAFRKGEHQLSEALKMARAGHWEYDVAGDMFTFNDNFYRIFRTTAEEVGGCQMSSADYARRFCHPDDIHLVAKEVEASINATDPNYSRQIEHRILYSDGQVGYITVLFYIVKDGQGRTVRTYGVNQDITERKHSEEALRQSEARFRNLFENMSNGVAIYEEVDGGRDFVFKDFNAAGELIDHISRDRVIGRRLTEVFPGVDAMGLLDVLCRVRKTGTAEQYPLSQYKDGRIAGWRENRIFRLPSGEVVAVYEDVTLRKQAESALRESEERLRLVMEHSPFGVAIIGSDRKIRWVNRQACELLLVSSADELRGKHCRDSFCSVNRSDCLAFDMNTKVDNSERILRRSNGEEIPVLRTVIRTELHGEPVLIVTFIDITEAKHLQELKSRAERLEMAGTVAGQVAHDFNNLLAPIMAYPEFIREELPEDHPALHMLDQIELAAERMSDINQDLLTMGRRGHQGREVINLNTVIQSILEDIRPCPETLTIEATLSGDLMNIMGSGAQLSRMVSNLLHNAADAMQNMGQITITTENCYVDDTSVAYGRIPIGEFVKLTISDTGCGIPADVVQRIFDPFFTTKTTSKKRGSGLGMSVVDAVVKDHNGYIDLSTEVGAGTSFYIYFPVSREAVDDRANDKYAGGRETILIVDDDDIQREVTSQLLTKLGYSVRCVESGEQAIEVLKASPADIVMLDMVMPGGIDGTETYRRITEFRPDQKAIILSGFSESDRVYEAQKMGVGAFVKKPVTRGAIAAAVRAELDRKTTSVSS